MQKFLIRKTVFYSNNLLVTLLSTRKLKKNEGSDHLFNYLANQHSQYYNELKNDTSLQKYFLLLHFLGFQKNLGRFQAKQMH